MMDKEDMKKEAKIEIHGDEIQIKEGDPLGDDRFKMVKELGKGSFGVVWMAEDRKNNNERVAIKFEKTKFWNKDTEEVENMDPGNAKLQSESRIYIWLGNDPESHKHNIPKAKCFFEGKNYIAFGMQMIGKSLDKLFEEQGNRFSLKTIDMIAIQGVRTLQFIHSKRILHRDMKPDNWAIGLGKDQSKLFLFDFGLSKSFMNHLGKHNTKKEKPKPKVGTPRYYSTFVHDGHEQGRRDDMQSFAHVLLFFALGAKLPWAGKNLGQFKSLKEKEDFAYLEKRDHNWLEDPSVPKHLAEYAEYTRRLKFEEVPDYDWIVKLFEDDLKRMGCTNDCRFDWC